MTTFYSNGKLLLTGEYVVLDGALSLALPTLKGQALIVKVLDEPKLIWKSLDPNKKIWFEAEYHLEKDEIIATQTPPDALSNTLLKILDAAKQRNPNFLQEPKGYEVTAILDFPRDWGLGSSSTLINNIANWAKIDAYELLERTFGGSGYDIACAQHLGPLTYQLQDAKRRIKPIAFFPKFSEHLYFVHLNKKQNSRDGIAHYESNKDHLRNPISKISAITKLIINCDALITFEALISRHETIISRLIKLPTVKQELFSDYQGAIKSLGAWGGDFILVSSKNDPSAYFIAKGFHTIVPYKAMVLK